MRNKKKKVLVAMSGGVDSSVAASLLVEEGYDVVGVTMQVWDYTECNLEEGKGTCCSSIDVEDARSVADYLNIPFYVLNCEAFFKEKVIEPFINSYLEGKTPIPCINCNTFLKFDHLFNKMKELECDYLATGHYAKLETCDEKIKLKTSSDDWKDQTYFLFTLPKKSLKHLMFPVGDMNKKDVRKYAEERNLPVFNKKDSTGICFIGKSGYSGFIESQNPPLKKGVLKKYPTGEILAKHEGIHKFTYGQRRGLGVSGSLDPLFVIKIDSKTHDVWLGEEKHLYSQNMKVENLHLINSFKEGETLKVKVRFAHGGGEAKVYKKDEKVEVEFLEPQRAITPGQAAVFYRNKELLGGGWIC